MSGLRWMLVVLGAAMALLGASATSQTPWFAWTDVGIGVVALVSGALLRDRISPARRAVAFVLGGASAVLWVLGIATSSVPWLPWFTLAFGVGFLVAAGTPVPTGAPREHSDDVV